MGDLTDIRDTQLPVMKRIPLDASALIVALLVILALTWINRK